MKLLDLFCGAGGSAAGYHAAGFDDITGVDNKPQRHYPFKFILADALDFLRYHLDQFDVIHASPPCQFYSRCRNFKNSRPGNPDLIAPLRSGLIFSGKVYVIENVTLSPLLNPIRLCGLMFNLKVLRHRLFESNLLLHAPPHPSHKDIIIGQNGFCCVVGNGGPYSGKREFSKAIDPLCKKKKAWKAAMGIDWMWKYELTQAIPPAYTKFIGEQILNNLKGVKTP